MADCTRLYYGKRLMNEITSGSMFRSFPRAKLDTAEQREAIAIKLKDGWVQNAAYDPMNFTIVHTKTDPVFLSKMTDDIIRKSRENIGV